MPITAPEGSVVVTLRQQERLIWAPDMFGSISFLIASTLAWVEVCHGWWRPATWEVANVPVANLGTFVGAVCFLIGAVLLIPELADRSPGTAAGGG